MQAERYRRRLEAHVAQGRTDAALATVAAWRARSPHLLEPELMHAQIDLVGGSYRAARDRAVAAVEQRDCPPDFALEVVDCLLAFVAHDALAAWATRYECWAAVEPRDRARAGAALSTLAPAGLVRALVDSAVADAPADALCLVNRAFVSSYAGDFDRAREDLEAAIHGPQDPAKAHWLLARLDRQTAERNHVRRLRDRLAAGVRAPVDAEYLNFALFKELDDLGDHVGAWSALEQGCRSVRDRLPDDRSGRERLFDALKRRFPLERSATVAADATVPIFIVGMHRSGTTLLEAMLGADAEVFAYGESQRFSSALRYAADHYCRSTVDQALVEQAARIDQDIVGDLFLREGRGVSRNARYVTEKLPDNFQLVGFIRHALPHAKVVHLRRDPMDLCFANLRERFGDGVTHSYAMDDVAHFHALYDDLMRHWHRVYPGFVLDVDYEDLVADPLATSRRVFEFCGLRWDPGVVDPARWSARCINTLSAVQARSQVIRTSVGRWRTYQEYLQPLQRALSRYSRA